MQDLINGDENFGHNFTDYIYSLTDEIDNVLEHKVIMGESGDFVIYYKVIE